MKNKGQAMKEAFTQENAIRKMAKLVAMRTRPVRGDMRSAVENVCVQDQYRQYIESAFFILMLVGVFCSIAWLAGLII